MEKNKIEQAKDTLREAGYYVDVMWQVSDVMLRYNVINVEDAQEILNITLNGEWLVEQTFEVIKDVALEKGFKLLEE